MQKPGSPDSDTSVRMVNNMKPVNPIIESPGYPMDTSSKILNSLNPDDVCYGVIDLVQGFHQVPVHEDSRDLLTYAGDIRQVEDRLKKLLTICRKRNMKISPSKFQVCSSVVFGGTVIEAHQQKGDSKRTVFLSPTQPSWKLVWTSQLLHVKRIFSPSWVLLLK